MGKTNCGNKELAFFHKSDQEGKKKATPDAVSIKRPKTMFEFGLPDIMAYSQRNITVPRSVRSCRRFLQDSFSLSFSLKSMTLQCATELSGFQSVKLSSFSNTEHRIQKWFIRIKVYFVLSKQEEPISSRHFVSKD